MKVRVFIAALLTAAAFFICLPSSAVAAPALFVVKGPAGKVYLFGTVHILRDGTLWHSPELEAAIADSQDLYLEVADVDNMGEAAKSMFATGIDRAHPLSTKISKADVALLDAAAKRYGMAGEVMFEPMRPWFAFMMLSALPSMHSGYKAANGVDKQIRKEFADAGKPVHGFETFDMQAHIFADMPEATQIALLEYALKNMDKQSSGSLVDSIVTAWQSGDEDALASTMNLAKDAGNPIEAAMLTNRNKAWAATLAERLKQPGTSFVAVGAAHLLGPEGVPALLQQMGFTVTRVAIADVPQTSSPSPQASTSPSIAPSVSPSPSPSPTPAPKPAAITPPNGWKAQNVPFPAGQLKLERMWVDPLRRGVIVTAHLDVEGLSGMGLDALDTFIHQGMIAAAGANAVGPSKRVKVCNGKQDALYTTITKETVKEDIVLTVSDRAYMAQYVRRKEMPTDPAAVKALLSLCTP